MKTCDSCKVVVDKDVSICPQCGKSLRNTSDDEQSKIVSELLSEAKLHRIHGELDAAIDKSTEALQLMPNNPDTHSLLGDIYESKGNLEEAINWYQMAMDLDPDSALNAAKLDRIQARLHSSRHEKAESITDGWLLSDSKRDTGLRKIILISILAVFVLAVFGLTALFLKYHAEQPEDSTDKQTQQQSVAVGQHEDIETTDPSATSDVEAQVITHPIAEQQLLSSLATNPAILSRRLIIEDVRIDPREKSLMLIFRLPDTEKTHTRESVLRHAAVAASAAFTASPGATRLEVRVLAEYQTKVSPREPKMVLIADVTRQVSALDANQAPINQLSKFFSNSWWGAELQ